MIRNTTFDKFEGEVLRSDSLVLVDFYNDSCGPCKAMAPALADIAREYAGELTILKVDIDTEAELRDRYDVTGIPAFMFVKQGEVVEHFVGGMTRSALSAKIEKHLDGGEQ